MGRALTTTGLLAVIAALVVAGCGGSSGSSTVARSTTTHANVGPRQKHSHASQINGDDAAFRMLCDANSPAARRAGLRALMLEIRSSPHAPDIKADDLARELKGACAGRPKTIARGG
jgi:hypothetical protein